MNNIDKLQELIDKSNNIVVFTGAGISVDSGLKDFRGKDGLYKEKNKYNFSPEYMLSSDCLYNNTKIFYEYYRDNMSSLDKEPNIAHNYLKKLEDKGKLKAVITQNIDGLHERSGVKNVLTVHGTTYRNYCDKCGKEYPYDYIFSSKGIPYCDCGGLIRPDVTLYGESLPECFMDAIRYIKQADLLIVVGTSLTVQPASNLVNYFNGDNMVIINNEETYYDYLASLIIREPIKEVFSKLK